MIRRRNSADETRPVVVVVLDRVSGDVATPNDALAVVLITCEGEAGGAVALRSHRPIEPVEHEDQTVNAVVVDHVDDRAATPPQ